MLAEEVKPMVADAPNVAGLSFRLFTGEADYAKILDILVAHTRHDQLDRYDTLEDVRRNYAYLENSDPYQDVLFAEVNGEAAAYCRTEWRLEEGPAARIYSSLGFMKPEYRRLGIERAMLRWCEAHQRGIAAGHEAETPRFFELQASQNETDKHALALSEGYAVVRQFNLMVRPDLENIPDLALPPGVEVRPALPEHYRQVWDAMDEAFRDHWGYSEQSETAYEGWLHERSFQPELWQVAWDGDQVVGTVLGYIDENANQQAGRLRGWTEEITVRRPWRGKGVAKALIARCLTALKQRGMSEAALGVDTQNLSGALRLYERMGYRPVERNTAYRKAF